MPRCHPRVCEDPNRSSELKNRAGDNRNQGFVNFIIEIIKVDKNY